MKNGRYLFFGDTVIALNDIPDLHPHSPNPFPARRKGGGGGGGGVCRNSHTSEIKRIDLCKEFIINTIKVHALEKVGYLDLLHSRINTGLPFKPYTPMVNNKRLLLL